MGMPCTCNGCSPRFLRASPLQLFPSPPEFPPILSRLPGERTTSGTHLRMEGSSSLSSSSSSSSSLASLRCRSSSAYLHVTLHISRCCCILTSRQQQMLQQSPFGKGISRVRSARVSASRLLVHAILVSQAHLSWVCSSLLASILSTSLRRISPIFLSVPAQRRCFHKVQLITALCLGRLLQIQSSRQQAAGPRCGVALGTPPASQIMLK